MGTEATTLGSADHQRLRRAEVGLANAASPMKADQPGSRGQRADVLPVAEGVRGDEDESGEAS